MRFSSRPRSVRLEVAEGLNGPALGARAAQLLCDAWSARRLHLVERTCLAVHDHVAELAAKVAEKTRAVEGQHKTMITRLRGVFSWGRNRKANRRPSLILSRLAVYSLRSDVLTSDIVLLVLFVPGL